jgi:hypothetical protein
MESSVFWNVTPLLTSTELHAVPSQNIEYFNFVDRFAALRFTATGGAVCREAHTNFADESARLVADNVRNEVK